MLKEKEIDIAIDLKGHTFKTRMSILSDKACPIQITYLGHPGTSEQVILTIKLLIILL